MARIKIEDVVEHLSSEFRRALADTIARELPDAEFDPHQLFRTFRRSVGRKCSTWETIPDQYVDTE